MVDMLGAIQFNVFYSLLYTGTLLITERLSPPWDQQRARGIGLRLNLGENTAHRLQPIVNKPVKKHCSVSFEVIE